MQVDKLTDLATDLNRKFLLALADEKKKTSEKTARAVHDILFSPFCLSSNSNLSGPFHFLIPHGNDAEKRVSQVHSSLLLKQIHQGEEG